MWPQLSENSFFQLRAIVDAKSGFLNNSLRQAPTKEEHILKKKFLKLYEVGFLFGFFLFSIFLSEWV